MQDIEQLKNIVNPLLTWYDGAKRSLPWREDVTAYRVWVSEIMLQQTRVNAVIAYFERFVKALPTIQALAQCDEQKLLKLWEGLGYYRRVKNLQAAAQVLCEQYGKEMPRNYQAVRALPGIGDYTAGAICSIAFQMPYTAVDGNVLRVLARYQNSREDILSTAVRKKAQENLTQVLPKRVGDFNQSLMELGAMICLPNGAPKCAVCPLQAHCMAYQNGTQEELPIKTPKKPKRIEERTILLPVCNGKVGLWKREDNGLLAGLWEFPNLLGVFREEALADWFLQRQLGNVQIEKTVATKHVFTHLEWHMQGYFCRLETPCNLFKWVTRAQREEYPLPSAYQAFAKLDF